MRYWAVYIVLYAIVGMFGLSPFRGSDLATLSPVEAVWMETVGGEVHVETDGGEVGVGATVQCALDNLKETAAATVFLDTADFLIVKTGNEMLISQLSDVLRPSCSVCVADRRPDLKQAAAFLAVHEPFVKMKTFCTVSDLPTLREEKGRLILIGKGNTGFSVDCVAGCCD